MHVEMARMDLVEELCWLAWRPEAPDHALVVDPGSNPERLLELARRHGVSVAAVLLTHNHGDHTAGTERLVATTGAAVHAPWDTAGQARVRDGDRVAVGPIAVEVLATPGHTPESVCYRADDVLFTGDTLFVGDCGAVHDRASALALRRSLFEVLVPLPGELRVCPGHDYGGSSATLGEIRESNYALEPRSEEEWIRWNEL